MNIGIVGLGKMGYAIAQRLQKAGNTVYGFDLDEQTKQRARSDNITLLDNIEEFAEYTTIVWLMIPVGKPVAATIKTLSHVLPDNTIIIDGGNSFYKDSIQHAHALAAKNIHFLDCGTSGGVHGLKHGFCLMVGGKKEVYDHALPLFKAVASPDGVAYMGESGTGHYVKMVHNGIEYGLLQAYAEGLHLLKDGAFKSKLNLHTITKLWNTSSVIRSFLLELTENILAKDQEFTNVKGSIAQGGTGSWASQSAHEHKIPTGILDHALEVRKQSRNNTGLYSNKLVALLREQFGGHHVEKIEP